MRPSFPIFDGYCVHLWGRMRRNPGSVLARTPCFQRSRLPAPTASRSRSRNLSILYPYCGCNVFASTPQPYVKVLVQAHLVTRPRTSECTSPILQDCFVKLTKVTKHPRRETESITLLPKKLSHGRSNPGSLRGVHASPGAPRYLPADPSLWEIATAIPTPLCAEHLSLPMACSPGAWD